MLPLQAETVRSPIRFQRQVDATAATDYDLVLSDPPYPLPVEAVQADLVALRDHGWLGAGALVVVERSSRGRALTWPDGYAAARDRRYGETVLWYGHAGPDDPATDPEEGES